MKKTQSGKTTTKMKLQTIKAMICGSMIAACGVSTFAREVLVPEMAVILIKEDMSVDDPEACRISEESTKIGELLNDEDDDDDDDDGMDGTRGGTYKAEWDRHP